jgi:hypothetical protein
MHAGENTHQCVQICKAENNLHKAGKGIKQNSISCWGTSVILLHSYTEIMYPHNDQVQLNNVNRQLK